MPALSFQPRFAPLVESQRKRQTVRAMRKRPFKVGDRLYLYTGMRTKLCRKLGEAKVVRVFGVVIDRDRLQWSLADGDAISIPAPSVISDNFAIDDGFKSYEDMIAWFDKTHGLPFLGQCIRWFPLWEST